MNALGAAGGAREARACPTKPRSNQVNAQSVHARTRAKRTCQGMQPPPPKHTRMGIQILILLRLRLTGSVRRRHGVAMVVGGEPLPRRQRLNLVVAVGVKEGDGAEQRLRQAAPDVPARADCVEACAPCRVRILRVWSGGRQRETDVRRGDRSDARRGAHTSDKHENRAAQSLTGPVGGRLAIPAAGEVIVVRLVSASEVGSGSVGRSARRGRTARTAKVASHANGTHVIIRKGWSRGTNRIVQQV